MLVGDFNVDARSEMPEKKNSEEYETLMKLLTTEYFKPIDILFEEGNLNLIENYTILFLLFL